MLDSSDRNNTIRLNLLAILSKDGREVRAMESRPSTAQLFTQIHYIRPVFVDEDAPEFATKLPVEEWAAERERGRIAQMLIEAPRRSATR